MKRVLIIVGLIIAIVLAVMCFRLTRDTKPEVSATERCVIKTDMRKLWTDHAVYTREVIACIVDNAPGKAEAIGRLLNNQNEIGDAIKPYYGEMAGRALTVLLREHIIIAADVVSAAKAGNKPALDAANRKWYDNSRRIAEFLSKANPHLDPADMRYMMDYHLKLTTNEAVTRIQHRYQANIEAYDKVYAEILMMSDMISVAIVKQFPEKFVDKGGEDNSGHDHY